MSEQLPEIPEIPTGAPVVPVDAPNVAPPAPIDQEPVTEWEGE
jgi:hypothetical protein